MMNCDAKAIGDWLAAGARSAPDAKDMEGQLRDRLVGCQISLSRVAMFVLALHAQITAATGAGAPSGCERWLFSRLLRRRSFVADQ